MKAGSGAKDLVHGSPVKFFSLKYSSSLADYVENCCYGTAEM